MKQDKITSLQYGSLYFFLVISFVMNIGYQTITKISNQDSIFDIILGGILILVLTVLILKLHNHYKNGILDSINKINNKLLRYLVTSFIAILITISIIYTLVTLVSFINYYILKEINPLIISIILVLTIVYLVTKGMSTITKVSEIFLYIFIFILVLGLIGLIKYIDLSNIRPLLTTNFSSHLGATSIYLLSTPLPLFLLLVIPKQSINITPKTKNIPYYLTILAIIIVFIELLIIISILGIELTNIYKYPDMIVYKKISFLNILERVEVFLSFNNFISSLFLLTLGIYFINQLAKQILNIKKEPLFLALFAIFLIITSSILIIPIELYLGINFIFLLITVISYLFISKTSITLSN